MDNAAAENGDFQQLIQRVREGSNEAAWELVNKYASHVLRVVRRNLHCNIRDKFDSQDFVQMVWASFFDDADQIRQMNSPAQFTALLAAMARNKVIGEVRHRTTQKFSVLREVRLEVESGADTSFCSLDPTPSQIAIARERWEHIIAGQPDYVRRILQYRLSGLTYEEIAAEVGMHERTVRKIVSKLLHGETDL